MKYPNTCFAMLALLSAAPAGIATVSAQTASSRDPIVITPPAVPNGSNWNRAPFPAARQRDDVRPPDGQAVDQNLPPNTPATDPEPHPLPEPTVAILQPQAGPAADPALLPTGRPTVGVAASLNAAQTAAAIQASAFEAREQLADDIEARMRAANTALASMRSSAREMNADARSQFRAADDEIKQAERAVRDSLRAARRATTAEWESARTRVASAFQAYADAVSRLDASAGLAPVAR